MNIYLQKDWGAQVVPFNWQESSTRTPIKTIDWMVEAELKHGRIAVRKLEGIHIYMILTHTQCLYQLISNHLKSAFSVCMSI